MSGVEIGQWAAALMAWASALTLVLAPWTRPPYRVALLASAWFGSNAVGMTIVVGVTPVGVGYGGLSAVLGWCAWQSRPPGRRRPGRVAGVVSAVAGRAGLVVVPASSAVRVVSG